MIFNVIQKFTMAGALIICLLQLTTLNSFGENGPPIPEPIYSELEYMLSLTKSGDPFDQTKVTGLVDFIATMPPATSSSLTKRSHVEGAFHSFTIDRRFPDLLGYVYNPDIPNYFTRPSSLQTHEWMTPEIENRLRRLVNEVDTLQDTIFLRGQEHETITPDTNTGSYYSYRQNRVVVLMPGPTGPVMISATVQDEKSEVGKRGCIVGDDKNWNYLYSQKTGLNKIGLGWVDAYMYKGSSVMVYVTDTSTGRIRAGLFKWLNAGWSKINMVKSHHILGGIKRFAADLKAVLEAPDLPDIEDVSYKFQELKAKDEEELRRLVSPYLELIVSSGDTGTCPSSFIDSVASGKYLEQMNSEEIIRILMLNYLKNHIDEPGGKDVG